MDIHSEIVSQIVHVEPLIGAFMRESISPVSSPRSTSFSVVARRSESQVVHSNPGPHSLDCIDSNVQNRLAHRAELQ